MKINIIFLLATFCLASYNFTGQNLHNNTWLLGGGSTIDNGMILTFNSGGLQIQEALTNYEGSYSNATYSSNNGEFLFASGGCRILTKDFEVMVNGDSINPGDIQAFNCGIGNGTGSSPLTQGTLILPKPSEDSTFVVLVLDWNGRVDITIDSMVSEYPVPITLYQNIVDMRLQNGLGEVVEKNSVVLQDTFSSGNIQAYRHKNGVDWWVVIPKNESNCYFSLLLTKNGFQSPPIVSCGGAEYGTLSSESSVTFTPDGEKYLRFNWWNGLQVFDFDNETGLLTFSKHADFTQDSFYYLHGLSVSSNSRYAYLSTITKVYQVDLKASDLDASKIVVGEYDGTVDPYPNIFNKSALASNGKIYITSLSSYLNMHVIHKPNEAGLACNFEQRGISLPTYGHAGMPNMPHYQDGFVSSKLKESESTTFLLNPNPTRGHLILQNQSNTPPKNLQIEFYNILGKLCKSQAIQSSISEMDISNLESGMYVWRIRRVSSTRDGAVLQVGKVLRID